MLDVLVNPKTKKLWCAHYKRPCFIAFEALNLRNEII